MSYRVDTTDLIPGAYVVGNTGLGVLGSAIPSTGLNGASFLYNDLSLPADADKEIRGLIVTPPAAGTFFAYEDGSFSFAGPDGAYSFVYRLYVDGVDMGTATASISIGAGLMGNAQLEGITASGAIAQGEGLFGTATLSGITAGGSISGFIPVSPVELRQMYDWLAALQPSAIADAVWAKTLP